MKIHKARYHDLPIVNDESICGKLVKKYTNVDSKVTCQKCLKILARMK